MEFEKVNEDLVFGDSTSIRRFQNFRFFPVTTSFQLPVRLAKPAVRNVLYFECWVEGRKKGVAKVGWAFAQKLSPDSPLACFLEINADGTEGMARITVGDFVEQEMLISTSDGKICIGCILDLQNLQCRFILNKVTYGPISLRPEMAGLPVFPAATLTNARVHMVFGSTPTDRFVHAPVGTAVAELMSLNTATAARSPQDATAFVRDLEVLMRNVRFAIDSGVVVAVEDNILKISSRQRLKSKAVQWSVLELDITSKPCSCALDKHSHSDCQRGQPTFIEAAKNLSLLFNDQSIPKWIYDFDRLKEIFVRSELANVKDHSLSLQFVNVLDMRDVVMRTELVAHPGSDPVKLRAELERLYPQCVVAEAKVKEDKLPSDHPTIAELLRLRLCLVELVGKSEEFRTPFPVQTLPKEEVKLEEHFLDYLEAVSDRHLFDKVFVDQLLVPEERRRMETVILRLFHIIRDQATKAGEKVDSTVEGVQQFLLHALAAYGQVTEGLSTMAVTAPATKAITSVESSEGMDSAEGGEGTLTSLAELQVASKRLCEMLHIGKIDTVFQNVDNQVSKMTYGEFLQEKVRAKGVESSYPTRHSVLLHFYEATAQRLTSKLHEYLNFGPLSQSMQSQNSALSRLVSAQLQELQQLRDVEVRRRLATLVKEQHHTRKERDQWKKAAESSKNQASAWQDRVSALEAELVSKNREVSMWKTRAEEYRNKLATVNPELVQQKEKEVQELEMKECATKAEREAADLEFVATHGQDAFLEIVRREKTCDLQALPPAMRQSVKSMQRSLHASLDKLATDMYSQEDHFLLELFQNADDCKYDGDSEPHVEIELNEQFVWFRTNESGFQPKDVRAICDIGDSTKTKHSDSTGNKGIGFKSVFMISDTPTVLSQQFKFMFDARSAHPLAMINPLDVTEDVLARLPRSPPMEGTAIYLPYRAQIVNPPSLCVEPALLLFLRQLRRIACDDRNLSIHTEWRRILTEPEPVDKPEANTTVTRELVKSDIGGVTTEYEFVVLRRTVEVPEGLGAPTTAIALAFPWGANRGVQQVFATLPVKNSGFNFAIQADFQLVSSRQEVESSNAWNLFLREQLVQLAIFGFANVPRLATTCLEYKPSLEGRSITTDPYWTTFSADLCRKIHDLAVIPTASGGPLPAPLVRRTSSISRDVGITGADLRRVLGMDFLCPNVETRGAGDLMSACQEFSLHDLLRFITSPMAELKSLKNFNRSQLIEILAVASDSDDVAWIDIADQITQIPLWPLTSNPQVWVPLKDGPIFSKCVYKWTPKSIRVLHNPKDADRIILQKFGYYNPVSARDIAMTIVENHISGMEGDGGVGDWKALTFIRDHWEAILSSDASTHWVSNINDKDFAQVLRNSLLLPAEQGGFLPVAQLTTPIVMGKEIPKEARTGCRCVLLPPKSIQLADWELLFCRLQTLLPPLSERPHLLINLNSILTTPRKPTEVENKVFTLYKERGMLSQLKMLFTVTSMQPEKSGAASKVSILGRSSVFNEKFRSYCGKHVPWVMVHPAWVGFAQDLGIHCEVSFKNLLQVLTDLPYTERKLIEVIYTKIDSMNIDEEDLRKELSSFRVPAREQLVKIEECVWNTGFWALGQATGLVILTSNISVTLQNFFVKKLGVRPNLGIEQLIEGLFIISSEEPLQSTQVGETSFVKVVDTTKLGLLYLEDLEKIIADDQASLQLERKKCPRCNTAECLPILDVKGKWTLPCRDICLVADLQDQIQNVVLEAMSKESESLRLLPKEILVKCPKIAAFLNIKKLSDSIQLGLVPSKVADTSDSPDRFYQVTGDGEQTFSLPMELLPKHDFPPCEELNITEIAVVPPIDLQFSITRPRATATDDSDSQAQVNCRFQLSGAMVFGQRMIICRQVLRNCSLLSCVLHLYASLQAKIPNRDVFFKATAARMTWWPEAFDMKYSKDFEVSETGPRVSTKLQTWSVNSISALRSSSKFLIGTNMFDIEPDLQELMKDCRMPFQEEASLELEDDGEDFTIDVSCSKVPVRREALEREDDVILLDGPETRPKWGTAQSHDRRSDAHPSASTNRSTGFGRPAPSGSMQVAMLSTDPKAPTPEPTKRMTFEEALACAISEEAPSDAYTPATGSEQPSSDQHQSSQSHEQTSSSSTPAQSTSWGRYAQKIGGEENPAKEALWERGVTAKSAGTLHDETDQKAMQHVRKQGLDAFRQAMMGQRIHSSVPLQRHTYKGKRPPVSMNAPLREGQMDENIAVGLRAEKFMYEMLAGSPSFTLDSWISSFREHIMQQHPDLPKPQRPADDSAGYDFEFEDTEGVLGTPGQRIYLEVKGTRKFQFPAAKAFDISANEIEMCRTLESDPKCKYVVALVGNVFEQPYLQTIIHGITEKLENGELQLSASSYNVTIANMHQGPPKRALEEAGEPPRKQPRYNQPAPRYDSIRFSGKGPQVSQQSGKGYGSSQAQSGKGYHQIPSQSGKGHQQPQQNQRLSLQMRMSGTPQASGKGRSGKGSKPHQRYA